MTAPHVPDVAESSSLDARYEKVEKKLRGIESQTGPQLVDRAVKVLEALFDFMEAPTQARMNGKGEALKDATDALSSMLTFHVEPDRRWCASLERFASGMKADPVKTALLLEDEASAILQQSKGGFTMAEIQKADEPPPADVISGLGQPGAVLTAGEVALLSGAGGLGKTMAALQLCLAAVAGEPFGTSCGLRVKRSPVLFASVEDRAFRMRQRVEAVLREVGQGNTYVLGSADEYGAVTALASEQVQASLGRFGFVDLGDSPLYAQSDTNRWASAEPSRAWGELWRSVERIAPEGGALVVIDPAVAAFDISHNDAGSVRRVLRAIRREATKRNASVLVVTHSNKAGRRKDAEDTDLVTGSAAWVDGVRGVLTLAPCPRGGAGHHAIRCIKANYGPRGWGQRIATFKRSYVWRTVAGGLE